MPGGPSVILTTESSYPYSYCGSASWCDALTNNLSEIRFAVVAFTDHPYQPPRYDPASNVGEVATVPFWGTADPAEYGPIPGLAEYLRRRWSTTEPEVTNAYLPSYKALLREIVTPTIRARSLGLTLLRMHQHLRAADFQVTQTREAVWDAFLSIVPPAWREMHPDDPPPTLDEISEAWRFLGRMLLPLSLDLPRVDMMHAVGSGFSGLPCVVQKLRWGTPYLLSEHGVYLRDQYQNLHTAASPFVRWFMLRLVGTVVDINCAFADRVCPASSSDARWLTWRGTERGRVHVVAHGVDPLKFSPSPALVRHPERRLVAGFAGAFDTAGRDNLRQAIDAVRERVPQVECQLHDSTLAETDEERCSLFRTADIVVLPAVASGFPFTLVEAMMAGCAIVAADAGSVREILGETGLIVRPNDPAALGEAISTLLLSSQAVQTLGEQARERALQHYTEQQFIDDYRRSYAGLILGQLQLTDGQDTDAELFDTLAAAATAIV